MSGTEILSGEQQRSAAQLARKKNLTCPLCGSPDLVAEEEADWLFGAPGEDFRIIMGCVVDPTHAPYVPLVLSEEEARQHLGLRPQTD